RRPGGCFFGDEKGRGWARSSAHPALTSLTSGPTSLNVRSPSRSPSRPRTQASAAVLGHRSPPDNTPRAGESDTTTRPSSTLGCAASVPNRALTASLHPSSREVTAKAATILDTHDMALLAGAKEVRERRVWPTPLTVHCQRSTRSGLADRKSTGK